MGEDLYLCVKHNFSSHLRDIVFVGEADDIISFDKIGDRETSYDIFNLQKCENCSFGYKMMQIGEWNQSARHRCEFCAMGAWKEAVIQLQSAMRCWRGYGVAAEAMLLVLRAIHGEPVHESHLRRDVKRCYYARPGNKWPDRETRTECVDIVREHTTPYDSIGISMTTIATSGIYLGLVVRITTAVNNNHQLAMLIAIWSVFDPPVKVETVTAPGHIELMCSFPIGPLITSMFIELMLVFICSVLAFKTWKLPDSFNESRFNSFCTFSSIVLWLAFIMSYFLTMSLHRALFLALSISANGFLFLGSLFLPKIFAIYFADESDLHLRFIGGRMSVTERIQVSHIGHFMQDANFGTSVAKQTIPEWLQHNNE
ncbi:hypothetical protein CAPTEDRAFT_212317 [Capitella teleta]|uniref:G-protein coupled receptors family 3 profile domain-containing protein n=1 Tax=Capitella teleta TaxID=283909 RepID=R7T7Y1_CAPTE|nr:hypothetical protein CAPTEDRAFT_212317 [Capitella teleta]|eukprot:ELT89558.1 hypothetical protein CAPTEDRAFT_212317 [Capitella teleta]